MTTPARRQYLRIKREHPDAILLFRMGDFYETFDDDARIVARELEIALTSREMGRGQRVPLAGIPCHALDSYLPRLIRRGYRVAICEQTSDPAAAKGIVDRAVLRVVTPGTVVEEAALDRKANNYLAAAVVEGGSVGLAHVDVTTSEFETTQFPLDQLTAEVARLAPAEVLVLDGSETPLGHPAPVATPLSPDAFDLAWARESLLRHFGVATLEAFGCEGLPLATRAAGAILDYLGRVQPAAVGRLTGLRTYSTDAFMVLDPQTVRNLELFQGGRWGAKGTSLLAVLDRTRTAMGGRLLRQWLGRPLLDVGEIEARLEAVAWFHRSALRRERVVAALEAVADVERLVNRVGAGTAGPRDLVALANSLELAPRIRSVLEEDDDAPQVSALAAGLRDNPEVVALVRSAIEDDPPAALGGERVIRAGFSPELDGLTHAARGAREYMASLEGKERERTGIRSLRVGYNKVFGYYIEVSRPNLERVPDDYVRRQTLVGGERYITPEMKEYEARILGAQERIGELEHALFRQVCGQVGASAPRLMATARAVAQVDALCSLAEVAERNGYVRPAIDDGPVVAIRQGRHPVVERMLDPGGFVPNDTRLSNADDQLIVLTGPNMAGKSTYIRQVALIVLMAQMGGYVPAEAASIGVVDRIFTRVGLQDDLAVGQSTFMVEMVETAAILRHATPRSLVIVDEIGRGTSTYDGLAIARAVAEYIHNHPRLGCKTLFATHYHELTALAEVLPRARNFNVAASEDQGRVVFLRRIVPGGADRSYGVHVARLAGLPGGVINRAWEVLTDLETEAADGRGAAVARRAGRRQPSRQLPLAGMASPVVEALLSLDVASMTPLEAINTLFELQKRARGGP